MASAPRTADLVTARRWLDAATRPHSKGVERWREQSVVDDAVLIGAALARQDEQSAARTWLTAAARSAPEQRLADIGGYLVDAGDLAAAEAALRRGAEAGVSRACLHLGRLLLFLDRPDESDQWLRAALEADPTSADELLGDLRARGADDIADRWSVFAVEIGNGEAALQLARSAVRRGEPIAAPAWLEQADQLGAAGVAEARMDIGRELFRGGFLAEAADVVRPAAAAVWLDAGALLGEIEHARGDFDAACAAYQQAAESGDGRAAHNLARLYQGVGDLEPARRWFVEGARGGAVKSFYQLAVLDPEPASAARRMILAAAHGHAGAALRVGITEAESGRRAEADHWLRYAQQLGDPQAGRALAALTDAVARSSSGRGR